MKKNLNKIQKDAEELGLNKLELTELYFTFIDKLHAKKSVLNGKFKDYFNKILKDDTFYYSKKAIGASQIYVYISPAKKVYFEICYDVLKILKTVIKGEKPYACRVKIFTEQEDILQTLIFFIISMIRLNPIENTEWDKIEKTYENCNVQKVISDWELLIEKYKMKF